MIWGVLFRTSFARLLKILIIWWRYGDSSWGVGGYFSLSLPCGSTATKWREVTMRIAGGYQKAPTTIYKQIICYCIDFPFNNMCRVTMVQETNILRTKPKCKQCHSTILMYVYLDTVLCQLFWMREAACHGNGDDKQRRVRLLDWRSLILTFFFYFYTLLCFLLQKPVLVVL